MEFLEYSSSLGQPANITQAGSNTVLRPLSQVVMVIIDRPQDPI